jgi:hypothetical protein
MFHPKYHVWLFSTDAFECAVTLRHLRAHSVPPMPEWIPDEWLDAAIEVAMTTRDDQGWFRYTGEQVAEEVWARMKPIDTYLQGEEPN